MIGFLKQKLRRLNAETVLHSQSIVEENEPRMHEYITCP